MTRWGPAGGRGPQAGSSKDGTAAWASGGGGRVGLPGVHSSVMPLSLIGNLGGKAGGVGAGHNRPDVEELTNNRLEIAGLYTHISVPFSKVTTGRLKIRQRVKRGQSPPELEA